MIVRTANRLLEAALSLVYPEVCQVCGSNRASLAEGLVCAVCQKQVRFIEPPFCVLCGRPAQGNITVAYACSLCRETELHFNSARSAVEYHGIIVELLHGYKYNQALWYEPYLARLLVQQARPQIEPADWDMVVPVPLHPVRQRERGFNQAERLAARLAEAAGIPLNKRLLRRVEYTRTQTMLNRAERAENMRNAFALRQGGPVLTGARILLVDDVMTTGATTNACARLLQQAGATSIQVWTLARGL